MFADPGQAPRPGGDPASADPGRHGAAAQRAARPLRGAGDSAAGRRRRARTASIAYWWSMWMRRCSSTRLMARDRRARSRRGRCSRRRQIAQPACTRPTMCWRIRARSPNLRQAVDRLHQRYLELCAETICCAGPRQRRGDANSTGPDKTRFTLALRLAQNRRHELLSRTADRRRAPNWRRSSTSSRSTSACARSCAWNFCIRRRPITASSTTPGAPARRCRACSRSSPSPRAATRAATC